jgi:5'-3' exoribonuclease 1
MTNDLTGMVSFVKQIISGQQYIPSFVLAKQLKIPNLVLSRVTSSMTVNCMRMKKSWNLGLEMKFEGKQLKVLGYTRKGERGWEFSYAAKDLIVAFMVYSGILTCGRLPFPTFLLDWFAIQTKTSMTIPTFTLRMTLHNEWRILVAGSRIRGSRILKRLPLTVMRSRLYVSSFIYIKDSIKKIQDRVDGIYEKYGQIKMKSINVTNVPRLALLKPEHTSYRLGDQDFKIGERIVHASDIGSAPLGAKGTIIGMESKYLEILFDEPFLSGSTLGGRYST